MSRYRKRSGQGLVTEQALRRYDDERARAVDVEADGITVRLDPPGKTPHPRLGRCPAGVLTTSAASRRRSLMAPAPGPRGIPPTKQIVPPAPSTDSHHDDRTPVIQTTGPQDLESAGREYRRHPDQVLNAHHLAWTKNASALVSRFVGQIARCAR
jgi:hypothetical protein